MKHLIRPEFYKNPAWLVGLVLYVLGGAVLYTMTVPAASWGELLPGFVLWLVL